MSVKTGKMSKVWRKLREWGIAKFVVLLFFPLFGRPLDFVDGPQRRSYAFAKWGWALPLAAASVWAKAMVTFYTFVSRSDFDVYAQRLGAQKAHAHVVTTEKIMFWETLILICVVAAVVAAVRFGYFLFASWVVSKFRRAPQRVPFRYFLTSTSSTMFLYGCVFWGVSLYFRHMSYVQPVLSIVGEKGTFIALGILGLLSYRVFQNRAMGVKELYGSSWIPFLVDVTAFAVLMGLLLLIPMLGSGT